MDKPQFIKSAPRYYALAIVSHLLRERSATTKSQIADDFAVTDPENPGVLLYIVHEGRLLDQAIELLVQGGLIVMDYDDFGPPLIVPVDDFLSAWTLLWQDEFSLYARYMRVGRTKDTWLRQALERLSDEERLLNIEDIDYDDPERDWQPIPVDRDQPELLAVIDAADDAAEKIRSDNGYSATHPEERNYVADGLATFSRRLKEATSVSLPDVRQYAVDPIIRASKSLGRSAAGLAVEVLKSRIRDWLMKQGIPWPFGWP